LPEAFRTLEQAQTQRVEETSSRLDLAGLTATEADTRLQELQALRERSASVTRGSQPSERVGHAQGGA
jgi:hypothetical protein